MEIPGTNPGNYVISVQMRLVPLEQFARETFKAAWRKIPFTQRRACFSSAVISTAMGAGPSTPLEGQRLRWTPPLLHCGSAQAGFGETTA